jgi:hypothetical protein
MAGVGLRPSIRFMGLHFGERGGEGAGNAECAAAPFAGKFSSLLTRALKFFPRLPMHWRYEHSVTAIPLQITHQF